MLTGFLLGVYTVGFVCMFWFTTIFVVLGGDSRDVWIPPVYAVLWPIVLAKWIMFK